MATDDEIKGELSEAYELTCDQCDYFRHNGYLKIKNVLSPSVVRRLRTELVRLLEDRFKRGIDDSKSGERFLSLEMIWLNNSLIRHFVLSPRIAKICADLLGVSKVRLYHDNVLAKESRCGRTPWHCDDDHFPLATQDVVTAWIPAQAIPSEMGPLAFAKPLEIFSFLKQIKFNKHDTTYDRAIIDTLKSKNIEVDDTAFSIGEVSFHHNRSFHTAGDNRTNKTRVVLANTFFADGARIMKEPTMVSGDWNKFIPGASPGDLAASPLNPICWPPQNKNI